MTHRAIPMTAVRSSSNVAAHGYDLASKTLAVQFAKGGTYHYAGVPPDVAARFAAAESKGSFVATHLRGKYDSKKLEPIPNPAHGAPRPPGHNPVG